MPLCLPPRLTACRHGFGLHDRHIQQPIQHFLDKWGQLAAACPGHSGPAFKQLVVDLKNLNDFGSWLTKATLESETLAVEAQQVRVHTRVHGYRFLGGFGF